MNKPKYKDNIDYLELVFDWSDKSIFEIVRPEIGENITIKTEQKGQYQIHYINDKVSLYVRNPRGVVEGRIYVKIINEFLYNGELFLTIDWIKRIIDLKFLYINRIDFCIDIKDVDILKQVDFNNLNELDKDYIVGEVNDKWGKTLYFNTIDMNNKRRTYTKQRVSAILYTKDIFIETHERSKKSRINPDGGKLTRLEIRLQRTPQETKDTHLLKTLSYYLWMKLDYFINHQRTITELIFNHYGDLYKLELNKLTFSYDYFSDTMDFIYINDFINDFNDVRTNFNLTHSKRKRERVKTSLDKKLWIKKINGFIDFSGVNWRDYINDDIVEKILNEVNIKDPIDFEYLRGTGEYKINGVDIFNDVYNFILERSKTILKGSDEELDEWSDIFD